MATFNVFGSSNEKDIKVGYISTDRGLVEGVTRCDANSYAKLNPGTQFIFRNRQEIKYLNINEVNALEVNDLGMETPDKSCQDYNQDPIPKLEPQECGKAKAFFYGGGGIGVKGTPIIGQDGGLMAVVLTSGGFGYQYPPITEVKDDCGVAGAAVVRSILGEQVATTEEYDNEEDFEEYDTDHFSCPPDPPRIINRNAAGKVTGEFDPRDYTNPDEVEDPIRREILRYQELLREMDRKPFWSTRMNAPLRVIGGGKNDRTKYDVRHFAWGGERVTTQPPPISTEFVDVTMKVYTQGGHKRGMLFNFASEDGTHTFTIKADNFPEDSQESITQQVKRNTVYSVVAEGQYEGKGVEQGLVDKLGRKPDEIKARDVGSEATGTVIFCDFVESSNDNDDLQVEVTQGTFTARNRDTENGHDTYELEYILGDSSVFVAETKTIIEDTFMNRYAISPVPPSSVKGTDFAGTVYTFEWEQSFPYSGEYTFRAMADNNCTLYLDNRKVMKVNRFEGRPDKLKKVVGQGVHKIRIDLYNTPQNIEETTVTQPPLEIESADNEHEIVYIDLHPANEELKVSSDRRRIDFSDGDGKFNDSDLQILEGDAVFSEDGRKIIGEGEVKVRFSWYEDTGGSNGMAVGQIRIIGGPNPENVRLLGSNRDFDKKDGRDTDTFTLVRPDNSTTLASNSDEGVQEQVVFSTVDFIDKADRQLWKTNYTAAPEGDFVNYYGICPFDTLSTEAASDDFAGTHTIRWDNLDFPIEGNYGIEVSVDDSVTLTFIDQSGNETIIEKEGFTGPTEGGGKGTGVSTVIQNLKAGKYKLIAELYQRGGKSLSGGNPMVLAVKITTYFTETTTTLERSWVDNPMGAAVTIVAPPVPKPDLPIPTSPGRCPDNPFWTTRFPGASNYWFPVIKEGPWSKFMNLYAISPLPPLAKRSTDGGGVVYQTSWDLDVPYSGYFGLKATADNGGRILIDGEEVLRGGLGYGSGGRRGGGRGVRHFADDPSTPKKVYIEKGLRKITVEVRNQDTEERQAYKQKVFDTADWAVSQTITEVTNEIEHEIVYIDLHPANEELKVSSDRKRIDFSDGDRKFNDSDLQILEGDAEFSADGRKILGQGSVKVRFSWYEDTGGGNGMAVGQIRIIGGPNPDNVRLLGSNRDFDKRDGQDTDTFILSAGETETVITGGTALTTGTAKGGVTYKGPPLASYSSGSLGPFITPAYTSDADYLANFQGTTWLMVWEGVDFPEQGSYTIEIEGDDIARIRIDGQELAVARTRQGVNSVDANVTAGKKTVEIELFNQGENTGPFSSNPTVVSAVINYNGSRGTGKSKSWDDNPMGISAELIPPPCPKEVGGKGVITDVVVDDPGNGFETPPLGPPPPDEQISPDAPEIVPVALELSSVTVVNPGINYNCGEDQIVIEPSNGAELSYECDTFGRIVRVNVDRPGTFVEAPSITITGPSGPDAPGPDVPGVPRPPRTLGTPGINFRAIPQFRVVIDPIGIPDEQLIQVTDLPGIKRTGFVNGRSYFGAVYYEDGLKFAGYFATVGEPVRVYDTLQESIDAQVTTPPSAIQRQGTDITSNDPRLNIPNTPDEIV